MIFDKFSLRSSLVISILAMGFLGILLAIYIGEQYREFSVDSQRSAFQEIIRLQVDDQLEELVRNSKALGQAVQARKEFRRFFKARNNDGLNKHLESQFHQFFVTTGLVSLVRLSLYDTDLNYITHSIAGHLTSDDLNQQYCGNLKARALAREGTNKLKVLSELCRINGLPHFAVLVPVGGLKISGYVEVLTDPSFNFKSIEKDVGMPLSMRLPDGKNVYQSADWPVDNVEINGILTSYVLKTNQQEDVLEVSLVHDVKQFQEKLYETQITVLLLAFAATLILAVMMYWVLKKTALDPISMLGKRLREIHKDDTALGRTVVLEGNSEIRDLAAGFNEMTQELKQLYDELLKANSGLKSEIGDRIRAEEELKKHRGKLEELVDKRTCDLVSVRDEALQASRAKSKFLANMSHELRTPLNAIIGYSEMLLEDAVALVNAEAQHDIEKIRNSGKHLLSLIDGILDLSKVEAGKMDIFAEEFSLDEVVSDLVATMQPLVSKNNNNFEVKCRENTRKLFTDQTKLRQTLFNLLSNANKFTKNGNIRLEIECKEMGGGDFAFFSVTDNGIGIAKEKMSDLFQAFTQADLSTTKEYGGTGLGLVISRHFCNMMGGDINVESEHGKGSCFKVIIPVDVSIKTSIGFMSTVSEELGHPMADPEVVRFTAETKEEEKYIERRSYVSRVLVIDDDPVSVDLMARFLAREGFRADIALSGAEGLRLAKELKPDVITLDIMMPQLDGWSVLDALKQDPELKDIPVVVLTMVDDRTRGFAMGAQNYLTKPFNRNELSEIIKDCVKISGSGKQSVLVIDDDVDVRNAARYVMEKNGWKVMEAGNGQEALLLLEEHNPELILLDLIMPEMDGFEFIANIRQHAVWNKIPMIVMTAKEVNTEESEALNDHAKFIFQKGVYSFTDLFDEVSVLLRQMLRNKSQDKDKIRAG